MPTAYLVDCNNNPNHHKQSDCLVAMLLLVQVPLAYFLSRFTDLRETGVFAAIAFSYLLFALLGTGAVRGRKWMMKNV